MARNGRPPLGAAVSESLFFKLPLELRMDIYRRLLVQEGGMSIPTDILKRVKAHRLCSIPICCKNCFAVFSNTTDFDRHQCPTYSFRNDPIYQLQHTPGVLGLPTVSTSILRLCRLAHLEALPILYTRNAFYFSNPSTIPIFLWNTDRTQAALIQEIIITMVVPYSSWESPYKMVDPWLTYVAQKKAGLRHDLPCLRRVIINLRERFKEASFYQTLPVFQCLSKNLRGLDWVHLNGLNNEKLLKYLEPMVLNDDESQTNRGQVQSLVTDIDQGSCWRPIPEFKQVRQDVSESPDAIGWKHVTMWFGTSRVPYQREPSEPLSA